MILYLLCALLVGHRVFVYAQIEEQHVLADPYAGVKNVAIIGSRHNENMISIIC